MKPGIKVIFYLLFLFLAIFNVRGQEDVVLDANPSSIKWKQIHTANFRILFPAGFEFQAQRMANTLQTIHGPESRTIGASPRKISIVLQNQSSVSNGFVAMGPKRSEFFTMPSQNYNFLGGNDWLNLLASHEYRHMAQYQHSIRGFNKIFYYLFGQEAVAGFSYVSAPQWFWEGDAVATETAFTQSGRGRIPNFNLVYRTNLLEGRTFNYHKQYLRSYKDYVPDHYVLGYHMVSYLRKKTGKAAIWGDITRRAWSVPFMPFAFSNAIKKEAGLRVRPLYNEMNTELRKQWSDQVQSLEFTPFDIVTKRKTTAFTNYLYPQLLTDGRVVALKTGIGDIDQLVILTDTGEKKEFVLGPVNESGMLSAAGTRIVWNEYRYDPRWPVKTFSIVRGHDIDSGRVSSKTISRKSRYSGSALSPDGKKVVTVETEADYHSRLVVINFLTGKIEKEFNNPDGAFYSMARWSDRGESIISLKQASASGLKSVVRINYRTSQEEVLIPPSEENIGYPVLSGKYLFYNSPMSGIDNIYAMDLETHKKYQVTCAKYGAYNPCISADGRYLFYNNQSKNGMDVVRTALNPLVWKNLEELPKSSFNFYQHLVEQEGRPHLFDSIPSTPYEIKRYRKALHMINPHSWGAYVTSDLTKATFGISSKDVLSTTKLYGGVEYDIQEKTITWKGEASLQSFYPIVDFTYSYGGRSVNVADSLEIITQIVSPDTTRKKIPLAFSWQERTGQAGIRLPLNLTQSKFYTGIILSNYLGFTTVTDFENSYDLGGRVVSTKFPQYFFRNYQDNGTLNFNHFKIAAYNLLRKSIRDINSKWGQVIYLNAINSMGKTDFSGRQSSFIAYMYLPGLFKHHSFWGYWAFQGTYIEWDRNNINFQTNYLFRNQIPLPRGIGMSRFEKMYTMAANYTLPVWYPDLSLGPLVNIKRVRINGFGDYGFGDNPARRALTNTPQSRSYLSMGGEVKFDINVFRLLPELDLGFRFSQGIYPNKTFVFEFLLGTINF